MAFSVYNKIWMLNLKPSVGDILRFGMPTCHWGFDPPLTHNGVFLGFHSYSYCLRHSNNQAAAKRPRVICSGRNCNNSSFNLLTEIPGQAIGWGVCTVHTAVMNMKVPLAACENPLEHKIQVKEK